jgi:hypothetical protein
MRCRAVDWIQMAPDNPMAGVREHYAAPLFLDHLSDYGAPLFLDHLRDYGAPLFLDHLSDYGAPLFLDQLSEYGAASETGYSAASSLLLVMTHRIVK